MGVFDQAAKWAIKADPEGFFRWRVPRFLADYRFVRFLDSTLPSFPGDPDRVCDTVAEFAPPEPGTSPCLLDVESQTEPDSRMLHRFGEYAYRLGREVQPAGGGEYVVVGMLVGLTGPDQPAELDQRVPQLGGAGNWCGVVQFPVRQEGARRALERLKAGELSPCVLFWVPLMNDAGAPAIIAQWLRLAGAEPDPRKRGDYGGIAKVFAVRRQFREHLGDAAPRRLARSPQGVEHERIPNRTGMATRSPH